MNGKAFITFFVVCSNFTHQMRSSIIIQRAKLLKYHFMSQHVPGNLRKHSCRGKEAAFEIRANFMLINYLKDIKAAVRETLAGEA